MKKTFLTLVAVGFGASVAFAQTSPTDPAQEEQQNTETTTDYSQDPQADQMQAQEEGRKQVEMHELPEDVQQAFKDGQYSQWEVLTIYEVSPEATDETATVGTEPQAVLYEIEVASATTDQEAGVEPTEEGMEGLETEKVSERQPDMVLFFDQTGQLVKEEAPEDEQFEE